MAKMSEKKVDKINRILEYIDHQNKDSGGYGVKIKIKELSIDLRDAKKYPETKPYLLSFFRKHPHIKTVIEKHVKEYLDSIFFVETFVKLLSDGNVKVYYYIEYYDDYEMEDDKELSQTYTHNGFIRFLKENVF